jgi:hypothetical protein
MKYSWQFNHSGIQVVAFVSPIWSNSHQVGQVVGDRDAVGAHYVQVKLKPTTPPRAGLSLEEMTEENIDQVILLDRGEFESIDPVSVTENGWFKGLAYLPNLGR